METTSPQLWARVGGALYILIFVLAGVSLFAWSGILVPDSPNATAHNILTAAPRLRIASAAEVIMFLTDTALAVIFYILFRPVDPNISLLAAFFRFGESILGAAIGVTQLAVLYLFEHSTYSYTFTPRQLQAITALLLHAHSDGFDIALVAFGIHCVLLGYLIYRSEFLPKVLGVLMSLAGLCYVVNSLADIAVPAFSAKIPFAILLLPFIAELGLCLWLLVFGVNVPKWESKIHRFAS